MHAKGVVLKIGGSLIDESANVLAQIPKNIPVLTVPGGGVFADFVRKADANDDESHWNAILAMDRFGRFLSTFGYPTTKELSFSNGTSVLLPYKILKERDPLPHSWDVTSDSIAAWVARELKAPLILAKSVSSKFPPEEGSDIVDPFVAEFAKKMNLRVIIANARRDDELANAINQATVL